MRYLVFIFIFFSFSAFPQKKKEKIPEPPNGVHIYDNVFMDETEIANVHWLEFLYYLKNDSSSSYFKSNLPDTLVNQNGFKLLDSANSYRYHYLRYPVSRYFPVIGVSYKQVMNYSKWRSWAVTRKFYTDMFKKGIIVDALVDSIWFFDYRIPTEKEWEYAASGGLNIDSFPYGLNNIFQNSKSFKKGKIYYYRSGETISKKNYKSTINENKYNEIFPALNCQFKNYSTLQDSLYYGVMIKELRKMPNYYYDFPPNNFGIYSMNGNVSEMVAEEGISKGGNFLSNVEDCQVRKRQMYTEPQAWLGFRNVCKVYKIPNPYR